MTIINAWLQTEKEKKNQRILENELDEIQDVYAFRHHHHHPRD